MIQSLRQLVKYGKIKDTYISNRNFNHGIKFTHDYLFIADNGRYKEILIKDDQFLRFVEISGIYYIQIISGDKIKFSYQIPDDVMRISTVYMNGDKKTIYF